MEETKNKFDFKAFIKKYGFYIGLVVIMTIAVTVLFSDKDIKYSGDVNYEQPVYYITGNNLYIKERDKDEVLISSTMFQDSEGRKKENALAAVLISEDGNYLYFFENIVIDTDEVMTGDFCVFYKGRKYLIEKNTGIYFAVSADSSKVVYIKPNYGVQGGSGYDKIRYDLYTYSIKEGKELLESGVEPAWYNISGDGNTVTYTKYYDAATDTSSLFIHKDGKSTFIDDHMFFYGDYVPKGTFIQNWPKLNFDGTRVVYGKRLKYGEMTKIYLYSNGIKTLLGEDALQVFVDEELNQALIIHNYDKDLFTGDMTRVNLDTFEREEVASDAWGLSAISVAQTVDSEYLNKNIYFKNYYDNLNVADLCIMTEAGEEVLLKSTNVSNIQFGNDYKTLYGLNYYVEEEGGELTKIVFNDYGYELFEFDGFVKKFTISPTGKYVAYLVDENLFFIGDENKKVYVDKGGIETFGILTGEEDLFFFREASLGSGNAYIRGLSSNGKSNLVAEATHYCWDFGDGSLAFLTDYDFGTSTGNMYITDGEGRYELLVENAELPLFFNFIQ